MFWTVKAAENGACDVNSSLVLLSSTTDQSVICPREIFVVDFLLAQAFVHVCASQLSTRELAWIQLTFSIRS